MLWSGKRKVKISVVNFHAWQIQVSIYWWSKTCIYFENQYKLWSVETIVHDLSVVSPFRFDQQSENCLLFCDIKLIKILRTLFELNSWSSCSLNGSHSKKALFKFIDHTELCCGLKSCSQLWWSSTHSMCKWMQIIIWFDLNNL